MFNIGLPYVNNEGWGRRSYSWVGWGNGGSQLVWGRWRMRLRDIRSNSSGVGVIPGGLGKRWFTTGVGQVEDKAEGHRK